MGLDMYLTKRFLCDVKVEINGAPLNIDAKRIDYISENFMSSIFINHLGKLLGGCSELHS